MSHKALSIDEKESDFMASASIELHGYLHNYDKTAKCVRSRGHRPGGDACKVCFIHFLYIYKGKITLVGALCCLTKQPLHIQRLSLHCSQPWFDSQPVSSMVCHHLSLSLLLLSCLHTVKYKPILPTRLPQFVHRELIHTLLLKV